MSCFRFIHQWIQNPSVLLGSGAWLEDLGHWRHDLSGFISSSAPPFLSASRLPWCNQLSSAQTLWVLELPTMAWKHKPLKPLLLLSCGYQVLNLGNEKKIPHNFPCFKVCSVWDQSSYCCFLELVLVGWILFHSFAFTLHTSLYLKYFLGFSHKRNHVIVNLTSEVKFKK